MGYKQFCKEPEKIENYEKAKKDNFKGWECHHRLETHTSDNIRRDVDIPKKELIALGMYYNRPATELIFLTSREHNAYRKGKPKSEETKKKLREAAKGKHCSEETRNKMREAKKGENNPFYGKHHSEGSKKKTADAMKGNKNALGCKRSEETRNKMREAAKGNKNVRGTRWYNNGKINIRAKECPPGFTPGRIKKL